MSRGNGNKGPWGNTPSGNSGGGGSRRPENEPDLDEFLRKSQESFKGMFGSNDGNNKRLGLIIAVAALLLWAGSGIYFVKPDELGIVLRFGEYHRTTEPGPNYHMPYPIETVIIPSVTSINKLEVGYRSGRGTQQGLHKESLMLTGDRNIVDIDFEVQWKIDAASPQNFLFNLRNPATLMKPVAERQCAK